MRVRLLGGLAVDGFAEHELGSRKARQVLKALALARGRPVTVDALTDILWPGAAPARPAEQLGVLVSRLRRTLGADRLPRSDAGYSWQVDWLDVDELEHLTALAVTALGEQRLGAARAAATAALDLARAPLLPEEEGEWVEQERAAAAAVARRARDVAMRAAARAGDHAGVVALAESCLSYDPYDEAALRALMNAHLLEGRPSTALALYARARLQLVEELGAAPTAETEAVHARALQAAAGGLPVAVAPPPAGPSLVGRASELADLDRALGQVRAGGTALVVVQGAAGIGKTTLVDTWTHAAAARGCTVLRGRCDELGRDLPLQPVSDALVELLRALDPDRARRVLGPDADLLAPLLGPVARPPATVVADPEHQRLAMFSALAAAVSRAGQDGPVVLVLEDLHLGGHSTVAWSSFARRRCHGVLLLVTTRAPLPLDATLLLPLDPLTLDEVRELVGGARADRLHELSGGHPLLLSALAATGDDLPRSLREAVDVELDALGGPAAATVRTAAVLGADCDLELIAQVQSMPVHAVLDHLEAAGALGLLVETGAAFAFRHGLVRDAVAEGVSPPRRALVHRDAARALAARRHPDALSVAVHAARGGDSTLASTWYVRAAGAALQRFDVAAAEDYLARAIGLRPTAEAYAARARVRMSGLALDGAAEDAVQAVALRGGAAALETAGWVAYYQRRYDEALAYAEEAASHTTDRALRVSAQALAGRVRHGAGDLEGAAACLQSPADGVPLPIRGVADVWLAQVRNHQGRPLDALEALSRPMVAPDVLAHPWAPLHLRFNRVMALGQLGRVGDALTVADELGGAVLRAGQVGRRFEAAAANVRAWVLRWSGRPDEADAENERALDVTGGADGPSGDSLSEAHFVALLDLADGRLQRGDPAGAAHLVERASRIDSWNGTMAWHQRHRLDVLRARLALAAGELGVAAELAGAVAADAAERGAGRYELIALAVLGLADPAVSAARLDPVVDGLGRCAVSDGWPLMAALATQRGVPRWQRAAEACVGQVVGASGEHPAAAAHLAERLLSRLAASPRGG